MNTPKKASSAPKRFVPTADQQITIGEAHQITSSSTLTVYGRLIGDVTISLAQAALVHPQGTSEDLQLALIFGIEENGKCSAVNLPQMVYMPNPDGPAVGCGWDDSKHYVMWTDLPKNWITIHVVSQPKTLAAALAPTTAADQGPRFLSDVMCLDWMKLSATVFIDPSWTLQAVWVKLHGGDFAFAQQVSLSNAIRDAYNGKTIDPKNLTATTTVQTVANWIPASV
jgi:hypothetical protein